MGTQKNRLNERVRLSTQNICFYRWVRKYLHFYAENFCLNLDLCLTVLFILQGHLSGYGIEEQLPTVAVVAHYDAFGISPVSLYTSFLIVRAKAKKKICVVQVTLPTLNFYPLPKLFSPNSEVGRE